jgi:hypothetical protein
MTFAIIEGPGILVVRFRMSPFKRHLINEVTFRDWYGYFRRRPASTSGIKSVYCYRDSNNFYLVGDTGNGKPFLAIYPMEDLAFTQSEEIRRIGFDTKILPGANANLVLDIEVGYLRSFKVTMRERVWVSILALVHVVGMMLTNW